MKKVTVFTTVMMLSIAAISYGKNGPLADFKLFNHELLFGFASPTSKKAPLMQYLDFTDKWEFSRLYDEMALSGASWIRSTNVNLNGRESNIIFATQTTDYKCRFFRVYYDHSLKRVETNPITYLDNLHAAESVSTIKMVAGAFTPDAKECNCQQLFIATHTTNNRDFTAGYFLTPGGTEMGALAWPWAVHGTIRNVWEYAAGDVDGDGLDEVINARLREDGVHNYVDIFYYNYRSFPGSWEVVKILDVLNYPCDFLNVAVGDINNDGKDEVIVLVSALSWLSVLTYYYDNTTQKWTQQRYDGNSNPLHNTLFDTDNVKDVGYSNSAYYLNVNMADIDHNGYCDVVFTASGKIGGRDTLHRWIYTFDRDGIARPKERVANMIENVGVGASTVIANCTGGAGGQIFTLTGLPALHEIFYDRDKNQFNVQNPITQGFNLNYGFSNPVLIADDLDNDSYWCRLQTDKIDEVTSFPGVDRPVAIITAPPYTPNNKNNTEISLTYRSAHDTLCAVQRVSGYGYTANASGGVDFKYGSIEASFEKIYRDTVSTRSETTVGFGDDTAYDVNLNHEAVVFYTSNGYYIYPYRVEYAYGSPVINEDGNEQIFYIFIPKSVALYSKTWGDYLSDFEKVYGADEKSKLISLMSPFMNGKPGDVLTYMRNSDPFSTPFHYTPAFPILRGQINESIVSLEKTWGKKTENSGSYERSTYTENSFSVGGSGRYEFIKAKASFKMFNFSHLKYRKQTSDEDYTQIELKIGGAAGGVSYEFESYVFWAPTGITSPAPGALVVTHRVLYGNAVQDKGIIPEEYKLSQNYPNPFNSQTLVTYSLPQETEVDLSVFNTNGQLVGTLAEGLQKAGEYKMNWNADDLPSGLYFLRLSTPHYHKTIKMTLTN